MRAADFARRGRKIVNAYRVPDLPGSSKPVSLVSTAGPVHLQRNMVRMRPVGAAVLFALCIAACGGAPADPALFGPPDAPVVPAGPRSCADVRQGVQNEISSILMEHGSGCLADSDCILVSTRLPCLDRCDEAVVAGDAAPFLDELDSYGAGVCAFVPAACASGPACAELAARCVGGGCHARRSPRPETRPHGRASDRPTGTIVTLCFGS